MVRVRVTNKFSNFANEAGVVSASDWAKDSFWVSVSMRGHVVTMARNYLAVV